MMAADAAFEAYEAVRGRLPPAKPGGACRRSGTLDDIASAFDVLLLDAFGVLNIGESAIPGVAERIAGLKAQGKRILVVTNAAGHPHPKLMSRYERLGFDFAPEDVISSRAALTAALRGEAPRRWAMMASAGHGFTQAEKMTAEYLGDDPAEYAEAEGFILLGTAEWTEARQALLAAALKDNPRPVFVGNPDIVAPREAGFSVEPGHFAHRLAEDTGIAPQFFGKPFANIFDLAFARIGGQVDRSRVLMVGDSLHTDILGAQTAGVASALIAGYGFFSGHDVARSVERSGIRPDYILERP